MSILLSDTKKDLKETLHHILDTFKTDLDVSRGIFLKPNIVFAVKKGSHEITSPDFVRALIAVLRERHSRIDIVIGEGVAAGCNPYNNFRVSGYSRLANELNIPLLDLNSADRKTVAWKFGKLELPNVALERVYINLPVLKRSSACVISGALKNQKGLVLPGVKKQFHRDGLQEQIAELNAVIKPALTILDGSFFFGRNAFIVGDNCGEIDTEACKLLGIDEPKHVELSRMAQVFTTEYSVQGLRFNLRRAAARPVVEEMKNLGRLRLWSNPQACTMCRYVFSEIQNHPLERNNFIAGTKLLPFSIKGAEIIIGSNPHWRKERDTVICFGNCTRSVAKEGGYIFIPGCPPTVNELNKKLP